MTVKSDEWFMRQAIACAKFAEEEGEVPIGAIVAYQDEVIGAGWNQPIGRHDPTAHAEVVALRDAAARVENYRLPDTTLYVTLEPCPMCAGAMMHARVKRLVFGALDPKRGAAGSIVNLLTADQGFNHIIEVEAGVLADECGERLRAFFRARR
ncbi:MAG: tRNA adenosine(34) deaminase TadA [bacterium]|nr:tRNA adenosine(34) deaminase TadA [bacterium]